MDAQADKLRARMAQSARCHSGVGVDFARKPATPELQAILAAPAGLARTIAVASGKGGVGKSTVALGIAMAAAERGVRTALIDADLGLANLDLLCGVQPARTAADWLAGRAALAQCFVRLGPRLWLLPGGSGIAQLADLEQQLRARMVEGLARVAGHVELMVVDLGAGLGAGTLDIAAASDRLLVVATPEPTSLADAYGFIKACTRRGRRERMMAAISMSAAADDGASAAARLVATAAKHLGAAVESVGEIPFDAAVQAAVRARVPLLTFANRSPAARAIRALEGRLARTSGEALASASQPIWVAGGAHSHEGFIASLARRLGVAWGRIAAAPRVELRPGLGPGAIAQ